MLRVEWLRIGAVLLCPTYALAQRQQASVIEAVHNGHAVGTSGTRADGTPLMHAALECRAGIVKFLLDNGANVSLRANSTPASPFMNNGQQALEIAAGCFIARRRAELAPSRGMPPTYIESELSSPATMVRNLIAHGADVNGADAEGKTPLMMAVMQGWAGAVKELISHHAAVNARDPDGRLAIDYADGGDREIMTLLQRADRSRQPDGPAAPVCDAERALNQHGYDTPIIDCIAGPQLRAAIKKFQKDRSLQPTGELDVATRKALVIR